MLSHLRPAFVMLAVMTLLTGFAYPLVITVAANVVFPVQANGSLVEADGRVIGSGLVGQAFSGERYFHPRPSAAGEGYDAANSSGSNLGPTSKKLIEAIGERAEALGATLANPAPADLVTASASRLDPHISPAAARYQAPRVAAARGLPPAIVTRLIEERTEGRTLGLLGEPRVNVLLLNLALDRLTAATR